jgi:hypothetical protein
MKQTIKISSNHMKTNIYLSCQPLKQAGCCSKGHVKSFEGRAKIAVIKP